MNIQFYREYLKNNGGIVCMAPTFVPRRFGSCGRRLRLHPDDYFALGTNRGSIKERWFTSTICAMNGPLAAKDEGMSYVNIDGNKEHKTAFKNMIDVMGREILGDKLFDKYGSWPMYSKFFDYEGPLFHHFHLGFEDAAKVGKLGKPESYYYPTQYNNYPGTFPHTYFGFAPDVTKEMIKERLTKYNNADIRITEISRAYRIELGTGWYTPPGVIHAPGSYLTYEPQWNSDVNVVFENVVCGEIFDDSFIYENCPADKIGDLDYVIDMMDFPRNVDPDYRKHYFCPPIELENTADCIIKQVVYNNDYFLAKEVTIKPDRSAVIYNESPYGCILLQGHGNMNGVNCSSPALIRYGEFTEDEFFIPSNIALNGIKITNESKYEPLVMLLHYPKI